MLKRGEFSDELIGVIIAVAGCAALIYFLFLIYSPGFDRVDETSESYFSMLEGAVDVADEGGRGEFYLIDLEGEEGDIEFYLVYFGDKVSFEEGDRVFVRRDSVKNGICVCVLDSDGYRCLDCMGLSLPAVYQSQSGVALVSGKLGSWVFEGDDRLVIEKRGDYYVFENL